MKNIKKHFYIYDYNHYASKEFPRVDSFFTFLLYIFHRLIFFAISPFTTVLV